MKTKRERIQEIDKEMEKLQAEQALLLEKLWAKNITEAEEERLEEIEARLEELWLVKDYTTDLI